MPHTEYLTEDMVRNYVVHRESDYQICREALGQKDYTKISQLAHKIKGSAESFGFPELTQLCRKLEVSLVDMDFSETEMLIEQFELWLELKKF